MSPNFRFPFGMTIVYNTRINGFKITITINIMILFRSSESHRHGVFDYTLIELIYLYTTG